MFRSLSRASAPMRTCPPRGDDSGPLIGSQNVVPVKPPPATPAPAATLALLRDRPAGAFDVLLIGRHGASRFAAGDFVFPGGKVEAEDNPDDAAAWCAGPDPARATRVLGLETAPHAALGYWIGAIRETFEGGGILLAYGPDGAPARAAAGARGAPPRRALAARSDDQEPRPARRRGLRRRDAPAPPGPSRADDQAAGDRRGGDGAGGAGG